MKTIIFLFLSIYVLISFDQIENNQVPLKTIITGQISDFDNSPEHNLIKFIYKDILAGQVHKYGIVDSSGYFKVILDIHYPIEFYLRYSSLLTFYVSPGDSLHFDINGDCWSTTSHTFADEYKFYKVTGTSEKMNEDILNYTAFLEDSIINWNVRDSMILVCTPFEYKDYLGNCSKKRLAILRDFNTFNRTCEQFQDWAKLDVKFGEWDDLMRYRWLSPTYKQKGRNGSLASIPEKYYDFIDNWDMENHEFLKCKNYLNFLQEYSMFYNEEFPINALAQIDRNAPDALIQNFRIRKTFILKHKPGLIREVLLAKMYYRFLHAKYYGAIKEVYSPNDFLDTIIVCKVQQKLQLEKEKYENPQYAVGSVLNEMKNESDFLKAFIGKYPNKVLYIDFWAPWCAPCIQEMLKAKPLKKQFEGKDVVFIYLANRCEEKGWKATIAEKKIEGEHYLLTDKQFEELGQIFGVTGIPHYALIDKSGNIIKDKAPPPSSGKELINLIEKQLN